MAAGFGTSRSRRKGDKKPQTRKTAGPRTGGALSDAVAEGELLPTPLAKNDFVITPGGISRDIPQSVSQPVSQCVRGMITKPVQTARLAADCNGAHRIRATALTHPDRADEATVARSSLEFVLSANHELSRPSQGEVGIGGCYECHPVVGRVLQPKEALKADGQLSPVWGRRLEEFSGAPMVFAAIIKT
jgi:hypothetical protein